MIDGRRPANPQPCLPPAIAPGATLEDLIEAVAARDNFIAIAAHELRNPMTPMLGQLDLLLRGLQTGKYNAAQIEQRLLRIRKVMNQYVRRATALLDVSRITTGKFRLAPIACDFAEIISEVAESFTEAAHYAGALIELEIPAATQGIWDRLALEQIADNLISNAIKYGGARPIQITLETSGTHVCLRVRDRGPGISPPDRDRIFERFERAVAPGEQRSGFGIGLWVVRQLVEAMDGTIMVDSHHGSDTSQLSGSVFSVTLPRHVEANANDQ